MTCGTCSRTCGTKIERPILRGLPFAFGVRLFQADGTPQDLSQFSIQCGIKTPLGVVTPFSVTTGTGLFVLSLTQAQTTALANGPYSSDILVRQGNEILRRTELVFRAKTPRTSPPIDPQLSSAPDPILEFRDSAAEVIRL